MSLQHIQKNSPRLLPKPAKFEKNPPNGYRVIRKTKCGAGGAGISPIHKQASHRGRLINVPGGHLVFQNEAKNIPRQDFMVMNISWKFEKASYNIFVVRAVTVKSLYTLRGGVTKRNP